MRLHRTLPRPLLLTGLLLLPTTGAWAACTVCHSKNPAMVRMHRATQEKGLGCFSCHKPTDKLMGKGLPKERDALLQRRERDQSCRPCHPAPAEGR